MDVSVRTELSHILGLLSKAIYLHTYFTFICTNVCVHVCLCITSVECPGSPAVGINQLPWHWGELPVGAGASLRKVAMSPASEHFLRKTAICLEALRSFGLWWLSSYSFDLR